jgi:mRNA interferase RelE/StbE
VICHFKKTFLKDLAEMPSVHRKKIEKLVFEDFPGMANLSDQLDVRKIQGHKNYYRLRVGQYRIGFAIESGDNIIFYRVKHRKDIYRVFP